MDKLPKIIPVFPLNNFIFFPKTSVPLNIFEPRYLEMVDDAMKSNKLIGIIQPMNLDKFEKKKPELHKIGCVGKITNFNKTEDGRYLIELKGIIRFEKLDEIITNKKYREFEVDCRKYVHDLDEKKNELKFSDLELIFRIVV